MLSHSITLRVCSLLQSISSDILNIHFLDGDSSWIQATLPVRTGGLGIRRAVQLAPSAFLASAAACSDLVYQIVPFSFHFYSIPHWSDALSAWSSNRNLTPPQGSDQLRQKNWDSLIVSSVVEDLIHDAPNVQARARVLAATCKESSAWLQALPMLSIGLRMDNDTVCIAAALRLGSSICRPHG